jgi:hypothetical protein
VEINFLVFFNSIPYLFILSEPFLSIIIGSYGAVAQLGERLVRNEEAVGSIPISSTAVLLVYSMFLRVVDIEVKSCATVRSSTPPGPEGSNGRLPKV